MTNDPAKQHVASERVQVPDPGLVRRAGYRMVLLLAVVLFLLTLFTAGGIAMLRVGELAGLPFAIGGAVAQAAAVAGVISALRVRASLVDDTVSARALAAARKTTAVVQRGLVTTTVGLLMYALLRAFFGDPATLLTAVVISVPLLVSARAAKRARHTMTQSATNRAA